MQWPEILFIFSSEVLFPEMLCINETHFKAGQKAKKKSLKIRGRRWGGEGEKPLKHKAETFLGKKTVSGKVEGNLQTV